MNPALLADVYRRGAESLELLRHPLLFAIRTYWGWSLMWNGWGKLNNLDAIARWFGEDLGIPMPYLNAIMAGSTECFGGLALVLGLASRPVAAAIAFTMTVAFATSDLAAVQTLGTDFFCYEGQALGSCFTLAAPFPYWFASILVLVFGPGALSLDGAIGRWWKQRQPAAPAKAAAR